MAILDVETMHGKVSIDEIPIICLQDVNKNYKIAAGDFQALKSVDLEINAGEFVSVIEQVGEWQKHAAKHDHRCRPSVYRRGLCQWHASP